MFLPTLRLLCASIGVWVERAIVLEEILGFQRHFNDVADYTNAVTLSSLSERRAYEPAIRYVVRPSVQGAREVAADERASAERTARVFAQTIKSVIFTFDVRDYYFSAVKDGRGDPTRGW